MKALTEDSKWPILESVQHLQLSTLPSVDYDKNSEGHNHLRRHNMQLKAWILSTNKTRVILGRTNESHSIYNLSVQSATLSKHIHMGL